MRHRLIQMDQMLCMSKQSPGTALHPTSTTLIVTVGSFKTGYLQRIYLKHPFKALQETVFFGVLTLHTLFQNLA